MSRAEDMEMPIRPSKSWLEAHGLTTWEFDEEVHVLGMVLFCTFQLSFSNPPAFSDDWFTPIGGGSARILARRRVLDRVEMLEIPPSSNP